MMGVLAAARRGRKPLLVVVALLTALGVRAYLTAPQSVFPQVSFARVEIFAWAGNLPPEEVRATVTRPLEAALQVLPVVETRSFSNQGTVEIELDFDPSTDPHADLQSVQSVVAAARPSLRAVTHIDIVIQHPNMEPAVTYALTGKTMSQARLRHVAELRVVPVFTGTPGLGRVTVFGGPNLEYRVTLDPQALTDAGITADEVAKTIAEANSVDAAATLDKGLGRRVVFAGEAVTDIATLSNVAVLDRRRDSFVPLRQIGEVALSDGPALQQASFDGQHAVLLSIYPVIGADTVSLQREVEARMPRLLDGLPPDTKITRYWDQTRLISASQESLRDAILIGALLALVVIYAFLRNLAITLVAAAIIPVAMALTILVIEQAGMPLSLMSLGGLAVAVGLIIDEVIVVIEAIARELAAAPEAPRVSTIMRATGRIARALLASTAANVVVFLPLAFLSGVPGFFFRALSITLGIALVVSIFLSLIVAPVLTETFLRAGKLHRGGLLALEPHYARLLDWVLHHRMAVYGGAVGVLAVTVLLFARLESDFLPGLEEGEFEIIYVLPEGMSLASVDYIATGLERVILADPAVEHEGRLTGVDTDGYEPTTQNAGTIRIALKPGAAANYEKVADRFRKAFEEAAPGSDFEFHQLLEDQLNDLSGAPEPIQIDVVGPDQAKLIDISTALAEKIEKVPGIVDVFDGVVEGNDMVRVMPKTDSGAGLSIGALADALTARIGGIVATELRDGDGTIPVRVVLSDIPPPKSFSTITIPTNDGLKPLRDVATIGEPTSATEVFERNGARRLQITAGIEGAPLSAVIAGIQEIVAGTPLPPGYHISIGGAYKEQQASFREFINVLGIAVVLVFLVLLATFNSFRLPLVVLATIPLSPIGVGLALWITRTPVNVSSFMGLLLLIGIVVRNGILLMDGANRRRLAGATVRDALIGAGTERLRPILMTTFAAIGALLPLALGIGAGSEMLVPLAIAVIGGLATATAFTLILIPVLYAGFSGRSIAPVGTIDMPKAA